VVSLSTELHDSALDYAKRLRWPLFPICPGSKRPLPGSHGYLDATTDVEQIEAWWRKTPEANIAAPTGVVFDVIDVEMAHLDAFLKWFGDPTNYPCVRTPSGGLHVYVAVTGKRCQRLWFGDFKGKGGYVLLPPSEIKHSLYHDYKGLE
jgi:hypothetical protein